ncbi:hypothetical protein OGAPHI_003793 [Ogataea philodendri]|uniref:Uncharacterized protein n=1 Tax=Ogataea philodendri TaxID=1378263 RepID=A0A9P8P5U8_9ASCO|nr:uncharacterized protein OGAPHI_003793 [Ogataea philodendri]KAH3665605.1 hypothetical protein OGAPHI_003793 [Ogataea philodendri]
MVRIVRSLNADRMVSWTIASVCCRCPADRFDPPSDILINNGFSLISSLSPASSYILRMCSFKWASSRASHSSSSVYISVGSMLDRNEPSKICESCGIIDSFDRKSYNPMLLVFTSSMSMWPLAASMIRKIANVNDDLPAPVLPTIPIFSFSFTEMLIFFNTRSSSGLYLALYSLNSMVPRNGQFWAGLLFSIIGGASGSNEAYSKTLSTETMLVSISTVILTIQFNDWVTCKA